MNKYLKEKYIRWVGISLVAFVLSLLDWEGSERFPFVVVYIESFLFTALFWNGSFYIFMLYRRLFPEISQTALRIILTLLSTVIWLSVGGIPLQLLLQHITWQEACQADSFLEYLPVNLITSGLVGSAYEMVYYFEKWKDTIRQNEELKSQQIRTQFEVLQNQMAPHFLFNSLNTLTTLIAENQQTAIEFTERLSDVYRYILQTKDKELVPLDEELQFAVSYVFLLRMRYPDNLTVKFDVADAFLHDHIAPLTLQMLIENAIKHNVISKAHPLHIEVYVENGFSVVVKNNLQRKATLEKGTKTGLANIRRRYELLGNRQIDVITTAMNFLVAIPLIKLVEETKIRHAI